MVSLEQAGMSMKNGNRYGKYSIVIVGRGIQLDWSGFFYVRETTAATDPLALWFGINDLSLFCCLTSAVDCYGRRFDDAALFCQNLARLRHRATRHVSLSRHGN